MLLVRSLQSDDATKEFSVLMVSDVICEVGLVRQDLG